MRRRKGIKSLKTRLVRYQLNPQFPDVQARIEGLARNFIGTIPGTRLRYGTITRAPGLEPGGITWFKETSWATLQDFDRYTEHPNLIAWCEQILHGWRITGSAQETLFRRKAEFITAVLAGELTPGSHSRDLEVPDNEVIWLGEEVIELATGPLVQTLLLQGWRQSLFNFLAGNHGGDPMIAGRFFDAILAFGTSCNEYFAPFDLGREISAAIVAAENWGNEFCPASGLRKELWGIITALVEETIAEQVLISVEYHLGSTPKRVRRE